MNVPNEAGARKWAEAYLAWLAPRFPELMTSQGGHWLRRDMIQEQLGIRILDDGSYQVPMIAASLLKTLSSKNKAAFDLTWRIVDQNARNGAPLPLGWEDLSTQINSGALKPPKQRGKTGAEHGVRDLVFKVMAVKLVEEFNVPLGRNDATLPNGRLASACEIIADACRAVNLPAPSDRSIEKAIRRCEDADLLDVP